MVYRKGIRLSGVPDAITPNSLLDSVKLFVCTRSGASGDSLPTSDNKFALANLYKINRKYASPNRIPCAAYPKSYTN
ncbi:hypothetical protein [uncultured Helicobacter sp.]|uniref:hypothetical protein n=1 Tax=uncultured Helicobacter sp. TaxID=175537 RepID=UPI00375089B6